VPADVHGPYVALASTLGERTRACTARSPSGWRAGLRRRAGYRSRRGGLEGARSREALATLDTLAKGSAALDESVRRKRRTC
jgi:hypothetical protein